MNKDKVLVIGASGAVGSEIVKNLVETGYAVKATTSKKATPSKGAVSYSYLDVASGEGVREAFEGVDRAFLMAPAGYADQYAVLSPLIQEAKRRGLKKVVLMSAYGADANDSAPLRRAELELEKSGLTYNVIRPNWFLQNFNTFWLKGIREEGKIFLPVRNAKASFLDTRDIGAVAAKLLLSDDRKNQSINLTGSVAYSHSDVAEAISKVTGKKITYEEIAPHAMRQGLLSAGLNAGYTDFLLLILGYLAEGYNAGVNDEVKKILGRDPISLEQYTKDHRAVWA